MQTNNNDVLSHHGVKGQKWGVRNYQFKDGSLTPKGKKRLGIGTVGAKLSKASKAASKKVSELNKKRIAKKQAKKAEKEAAKRDTAFQKKSVTDMSDEELNRAIRRAQMEDQYARLRPEQESKGKAFVNTVGSQVIKPALIAAGKRGLENFLNKKLDGLLKDADDPNSLDALRKTAEKLRTQEEIKMLKKHGVSNWKDANTKQQVENKYKEAADKEAKAKEAADAAARKANEARSRAEYEKANSQYNKSGDTITDAKTVIKENADKQLPVLYSESKARESWERTIRDTWGTTNAGEIIAEWERRQK